MDPTVQKVLAWLLLGLIVILSVWWIWRKSKKSKGLTGDISGVACNFYDGDPIMLDDDGRVYNLFMPTSGCHKAFATARDWDDNRDPPYTSGAFFCLSDSLSTVIDADSSGHAIYINVEPLVIEVTKDKRARPLTYDDEFRLYTFEPHFQWKQKVMLDRVADERQLVNSDYPSGTGPGAEGITFKFKDYVKQHPDGYAHFGDRFYLAVKEDGDAKIKTGPDCHDLHYPTALTTNSCGDDIEFILNPFPGSTSS